MDLLNPLSTLILQSTQLDAQQAAEKRRQVRKTQSLLKDVAAQDDEMEHQVESAEAVADIHDQGQGQQESPQRENHGSNLDEDEEHPHLDLTA